MSTATLGSAVALDGPPPVRPKFGLLDVATILPPSADPHWMNGGTVRGYSTDLPYGWAGCLGGGQGSGAVKDKGSGLDFPTFGPFTVVLPVTCSAFSSRPDDEFRTRALAAFEAKEGWAVERQLVEGAWQELNPFLANSNADVLASGAAVSAVEGLALLENAIGATAEGGVIHADQATATAWAQWSLLIRDSNVLRTMLGTPVAVGGGYIGAQPEGEAAAGADQGWAFASGQIVIRRDADEVIPGTLGEALDRSTNEVTEYAERHYLMSWDVELQAAVLIDRSM